ncbi:MAG TPA: hypothetical protein VFQ91_18355 [Bryobacteraceae bacterium]|nr:hypothetical protein [Bryobacteraceae bacterium]
MSLLPTAAEGLRQAEERIQRVAERLARIPLEIDGTTPQDVVDLSAEVVALLEAKNAHAINASVAETATEMDQHTLDILG